MSKNYTATKHLYTLNDSRKSSSDEESGVESVQEDSGIDFDDLQRENKKLNKKNQDLQRKIVQMQLKNQELVELTKISERRNAKHQQKQRDLIKKLSYYQVGNQQMELQIKKVQQDMIQVRQNKKVSDGHTSQLKQLIKKTQGDKDKFLTFLKNVVQMLRKCDRSEDYELEKQKIVQFINKNISNAEGSQKIGFDFDFKFQMNRVDTLREKIKTTERELDQTIQILEKERLDRKRLIASYNQKMSKLKQLHEDLKSRVQLQEEEHHRKIKFILQQKNELIETLKSKLKESRVRKASMQQRRSRGNKSFIGDGEYSHLELTQLNSAIETLEMQIIKQFQQ